MDKKIGVYICTGCGIGEALDVEALGKAATGHTLYLLDEPTTGLHFADIHNLLNVLQRLCDMGNTAHITRQMSDMRNTAHITHQMSGIRNIAQI